VKRSKPLKYAYEKEIVLYAHHKSLDYFSTECVYSPEAFRGSARALIKNLERVRPSSILDVVRSGEDMARLVPGAEADGCGACAGDGKVSMHQSGEDDAAKAGCGREEGQGGEEEMRAMQQKLQADEAAAEAGREVEITATKQNSITTTLVERPPRPDIQSSALHHHSKPSNNTVPITPRKPKGPATTPRKIPTQTMGQCARCGYLSSQAICKACVLLEGLNKNRPKTAIVATGAEDGV
jgi:cytoplasmic tRNA 2-thiolation protein 1